MKGPTGSALAEALVAAFLGGLAVAALTSTVVSTARGLRQAAESSLALALASERLERLRAIPEPDGHDTPVASGITFDRRWTTTPGRGAPDSLSVVVRDGGVVRAALRTEIAR